MDASTSQCAFRNVGQSTVYFRVEEEFGDKGLVVQLEDIVRDESTHSKETERLLRDWPD